MREVTAALSCFALSTAVLLVAGCLSSYSSYTRDPAKAKAYHTRYQPYCGHLRSRANPPAPQSGGPSKAAPDVRAVMRENAAAVHACFSEAVSIWPELAGDAVLRLNIDERGSVQSFAVAGETAEIRSVGCCVGEASLGWNFHEQPAQVAVQFRVEFNNYGSDPSPKDVNEWLYDVPRGSIYDPRVPGSDDKPSEGAITVPGTVPVGW